MTSLLFQLLPAAPSCPLSAGSLSLHEEAGQEQKSGGTLARLGSARLPPPGCCSRTSAPNTAAAVTPQPVHGPKHAPAAGLAWLGLAWHWSSRGPAAGTDAEQPGGGKGAGALRRRAPVPVARVGAGWPRPAAALARRARVQITRSIPHKSPDTSHYSPALKCILSRGVCSVSRLQYSRSLLEGAPAAGASWLATELNNNNNKQTTTTPQPTSVRRR